MLPATASENAVTRLPATATLPTVPIEPATAALATVAAEPATPAPATVATDPATAVLDAVAGDATRRCSVSRALSFSRFTTFKLNTHVRVEQTDMFATARPAH
jgi:hypothetical protein